LKKECERLGVKIFDRVMITSFLTEGGVQGGRVIGATGLNNRTGEFMIFKSKAAVLATAGPGTSIWAFNTEQGGYAGMSSRNTVGDGASMLWRAGGELTLLERNRPFQGTSGYKHMWYTGASDASYENVPLVDDNGKKLPVRIEGWGYKRMPGDGTLPINSWDTVHEGILKGEYALPFYGDFPAMAEVERNTTWGLMIGQESTTKIITKTYNESGFDPAKDQLQSYRFLEVQSPPQWREPRTGGVIVDWDLKTSLDGLYVSGNQIYSPGDHSFAASTGRYAGRKAAAYAKQIGETSISREQVAKEKIRVYAPTKRDSGMEWKELHIGITRVMQYYCSAYKNESLINIGLDSLKEIEEKYVPKLYALDPHKLMRSLEDLSVLTYAQIILNASLARKASSKLLDFYRIDYPEIDPPEWQKFLTIKQENNKVKIGERPTAYWGNLKENYEARNKDYTGVYQR
jgi:succinate dehydrogenase/fumarate reductase flavoprotein subunit